MQPPLFFGNQICNWVLRQVVALARFACAHCTAGRDAAYGLVERAEYTVAVVDRGICYYKVL